jgi:hypothetical protein
MNTMNVQEQRDYLNIEVSKCISELVTFGVENVCTDEHQVGLDMFFPARKTGRRVQLIGPALKISQNYEENKGERVANVGSLSVRVPGKHGNHRRIDLTTFKDISTDPKESPGGWWSAGLAEMESPEAATALSQIFQDNDIACTTLGTAYEYAKEQGNTDATKNFEALANFAFEFRGINFLGKTSEPRFNLDSLICIYEVSGGPSNKTRNWTNFKERNQGGNQGGAQRQTQRGRNLSQ